MKRTPKTDTRSTSEKGQDDHLIEASKDIILLRDLPLETRIEEANKPMYLTRYE